MTDVRQKLVVQDAENKIDKILNDIYEQRSRIAAKGPTASIAILVLSLFCSIMLIIYCRPIMNYCVPVLKDIYHANENAAIWFWISFFMVEYFLWFVALKYFASACYYGAIRARANKLDSVRNEYERVRSRLKITCNELNSEMKKRDIVFTTDKKSYIAQDEAMKRKIQKQSMFNESRAIQGGFYFFYFASLLAFILQYAVVLIRINEVTRFPGQDHLPERICCLLLMFSALIIVHYLFITRMKLGLLSYGVSLIITLLFASIIGACTAIFWTIVFYFIIIYPIYKYRKYRQRR